MSRKLKVVLLHNTIAPYRHILFEKLAQLCELIVLFCSEKPRHRDWEIWPRSYKYNYKVLPGTSPLEFDFNPSIIGEILSLKPDVVVIADYSKPTMMLAFYTCRLRDIPVVYWTEGVEEPQDILGKLAKPVRRSFNKNSDAIIAQGELTRMYLMSQNVPPNKIQIAHNCIEEKAFVEASDLYRVNKHILRKEYGIPLNHTVFLFVGALIERKGVKILVDIWTRIQDTEEKVYLIIFGTGPLKEYIDKEIAEQRLKKTLTLDSGRSQENLIKIYSISDVLLFPTQFDLAPLVLNEAMACRLTLIVSEGAGNSHELVEAGVNGFILPREDVEAFAETIRNMVKDPTKLSGMGRVSRDILLKRCSSKKTSEGFMKAINAAYYGHHRKKA